MMSNHRPALDSAVTSCFRARRRRRGASDAERSVLMRMPEVTANESADRGIGFWIMMTLGAVVVLYLFGFTVLVLFPQAARAAQAMGLSEDTLEKIYSPILRFLR
jgi:hypothetical protein